jgi:hypothetical protein
MPISLMNPVTRGVIAASLVLALMSPAIVRCERGGLDSCASKIDPGKGLVVAIKSAATDDTAMGRIANTMGQGEFVAALPTPQARSLVLPATG